MRPGVLADLESEGNALGPRLTREDRKALVDARERVLAQPGAAQESLGKILARLAPATTLKIPRVALCTRVSGFGRFETFASDTFVAGRVLRAIVYSELDGFAYRPAREGDPAQAGVPAAEQVSVELSQSVSLYHDPSGLLAWHRPAQRVVETTRNKRRDFYLIHQVALP